MNKLFFSSLFFFFSIISVFSQTWSAEQDGTRYQLSRVSDGVYTLKAKFGSSGSIVTSKIVRYSIKYDNAYGLKTMVFSKKDEYCKETITSGNGKPWPNVVVSWHKSSICWPDPNCQTLSLIIDDGFDIRVITFTQD